MIETLVRKGFFRNANHAIWFLCTFPILVLGLLIAFYPKPLPWALLALPAIFHVSPIALAVRKRGFDHEIYSRDCIWFNAAMILAYIIAFGFAIT